MSGVNPLVVHAVDPAGDLRGTVPYDDVDCVLRFLDVGTITVRCAWMPKTFRYADAGWRLVVTEDDEVVTSGWITTPSGTEGGDDGRRKPGLLTLNAEDDTVLIRDRLAWPTPTAPLATQSLPYDLRSGPAARVVQDYVDVNAGAAAHPQRRIDGLTVAGDTNLGTAVSGSARMDPLLDLIVPLAEQGGIGFRVVGGLGPGRVFETYEPRDLRERGRFAIALGNVRKIGYSLTAPGATHVIAGGKGEEENRAFLEEGDAAAQTRWGRRIEAFYDYRSADLIELAVSAGKRLGELTEVEQATLTPIDTDRWRYGRDYTLGDIIAVDLGTDRSFAQVIRQVQIGASRGKGRRWVRPTVGAYNAGTVRVAARRAAQLAARLAVVERR